MYITYPQDRPEQGIHDTKGAEQKPAIGSLQAQLLQPPHGESAGVGPEREEAVDLAPRGCADGDGARVPGDEIGGEFVAHVREAGVHLGGGAAGERAQFPVARPQGEIRTELGEEFADGEGVVDRDDFSVIVGVGYLEERDETAGRDGVDLLVFHPISKKW